MVASRTIEPMEAVTLSLAVRSLQHLANSLCQG